jgi:selenide, water dikinase
MLALTGWRAPHRPTTVAALYQNGVAMVTKPVLTEEESPRLTQLASCAGCAGKAGADMLAQVLSHLSELQNGHHPNLLIGLTAPDDATVYKLSDDQAVVLTVDFFAPLVDDPRDYGAIAAANALSDVYAMGAEAVLALNIAAFPSDLPPQTVAAILQGGADKVAEAGAVVAGGHTIIDAEPKYGLCVLGLVHPQRVLTKAGAQPGDAVYLTKPLGTGLVTTAAKFDEATPEHLQAAITSMTTLNRHASHLAREAGVQALTDVTGYGILGHANEMSIAGNVCMRFTASALPTLPGALEYAYRGITTGGAARNRRYLDRKVHISPEISEELEHLLFDPQTSGGLLFTAPPDSEIESRFAHSGAPLWCVGEVIEGAGVAVVP